MNIDLNSIGIGAIIGSSIVTYVNILLHKRNIKYDRSKQQLEKLYNPLNALIADKKKYLTFLKLNSEAFEKFAVEYYNFFLELRRIYLTNEVYASLQLRTSFHHLEHNHQLEFRNYSKFFKLNTKEDIYKQVALFELNRLKNDNGLSEFEQNIEKFIETLNNDIYNIYNQKPVVRYYQEEKYFWRIFKRDI